MKLIENRQMEISKIPAAGAKPSPCPICGIAVPNVQCRHWVEVKEKPADDAGDKAAAVSFAICETCAVRALRRVYEFCGFGRGVDALPAERLAGPRFR